MGNQGYFAVRCCPGCPQGRSGAAAPGLCLTWDPAAALSVSALAARAQLASTVNPDGWPGAASNRAAFTDVVPKSIPRVTGREAMALVTAQLGWLEPHAEEHFTPEGSRGRSVLVNLLTAPIGRRKQTPRARPSGLRR